MASHQIFAPGAAISLRHWGGLSNFTGIYWEGPHSVGGSSAWNIAGAQYNFKNVKYESSHVSYRQMANLLTFVIVRITYNSKV